MVLSSGSWPFQQCQPLTLPTELEKSYQRFTDFYSSQHNGRKLSWLYSFSKGEIITNCFKNRYTLQASTYQIAILLLFNEKTSQNQISHYLDQIRNAIRTDFVPFFLGAKNGKEFFLFHNNITTNELHNLKRDDLAIFADGTYCRCEKSSNNQVQYDCYSDQKKDSLIKPFLICCADGYIIDCYGPFKANKNDATILDYILDKDEDLMSILEPEKTFVFIDRGK